MSELPSDIFTEPDFDPNTLANLGPLATMAGTFSGDEGHDVHPVAAGSEENVFVEHYKLEPIDPQTNGPQLLYGLRYHTRIVKPGEIETFHDQVGYWLYEPATETVTLTIAIPRGQVAMATGHAASDARSFEVIATRESLTAGILSNPFLEASFTTTSFSMQVDVSEQDAWSYAQTTLLEIPGRPAPFEHTDRNRLVRRAPATPNPTAQ
jgi:hypothetical protein